MRIRVTALSVLAALAASPALAHHGWSTYDPARQQSVSGKVVELKWQQPHAVVWIERDGERHEVWLSPLNRMLSRGLQPEALSNGVTITVDAQPRKTDASEWKAQAITVGDKTFDLMR